MSGEEERPGYTAYTDDSGRVCGLTIQTLTADDLGEWQCKIQPPDGQQHFQLGVVSLLTSEEGFVRDMRLPRHVIPSAYDVTLTPFIIPDNYTIQGSVIITAKTEEAENKCENKVNTQLVILSL